MHTRRSDSYDDTGVDPEKLEKIEHDSSKNKSHSTFHSYGDEEVTALPNGFPVSIPYSTVQTATHPPPTAPPARRPLLSRIKTEYILLSKRTKIIILAVIAAVLILIIGLAAGLSTKKNHSQNLPLPSNHGGPYTGDLTYYAPALGSCGITSSSSDSIVAVSHLLYDAVSTGSNPNANALCGKKIRARRNGRSVDLTVVDRCVGCKATDLDVTDSVFKQLADIDQGRVTVEWAWLEDVPGGFIPTSTPSSTRYANSTVPASTMSSTSAVASTTVAGASSSAPPPATPTQPATSAPPATTVAPSTTPPAPSSSAAPTTPPPSSAAPSSDPGAPSSTNAPPTSAAPAPTTTA